MAKYLILWKFSGDTAGIDQDPIKEAIAEGAPASHALMEKHGGRLEAVYLSMGQYDAVAIAEFPDEIACARAMLSWRDFGGTTETLRLFPEEEWGTIAAGM